MGRTRFEARMDKRANLRDCEEKGIVADSMDVRRALMERVFAGQITLEQAQTELKKIRKDAKKNGMITRTQAFNRG